ncbi:methyltransferase domain-containing protein [Endozoicomonas sp. 4G]|uniref:methyltransferase domain-containing protein n=1 Tax=Endozoicomonas sp. 4G TaxID=2872754 RepID=UPI0020788EA4|nr:methyltransferase domain-containing protein [Endozoicomonas sp. 4G]
MTIFAFLSGVLLTWLVMSGLLSQLISFIISIWWPSSSGERGMQADQWLLNSGVSTSSGWRLIGYWRETSDYGQACSELAGLLADKACLSNQDKVLDVGFSSYDQLLVWLDYYQVESLTALAETEQLLAGAQDQCHHYDQLKLVRGHEAELAKLDADSFDKLLALDCAYHFDNKPRFFNNARKVIKEGGSLTLTDMVLSRPFKDRMEQRMVNLLARSCGISVEGLMTQQKYEYHLQEAGFEKIECVDISQDVLSGFCFWFSQHYRQLSPVTRPKVWIRLRLLVWFIRWMQHRGLLEYHVISAR